MASTIAELAAGQAVMTDKCLTEMAAGSLTTGATYKLVLLNLALGTATLSSAATAFWSDLSAAETNTKSDGVTATPLGYTKGTAITLAGTNIPAITAHTWALDWTDVSLDNADFKCDAYAIVRDTGSLATSPVLMLGKYTGPMTPSGVGVGNFKSTIASVIKFVAGTVA